MGASSRRSEWMQGMRAMRREAGARVVHVMDGLGAVSRVGFATPNVCRPLALIAVKLALVLK